MNAYKMVEKDKNTSFELIRNVRPWEIIVLGQNIGFGFVDENASIEELHPMAGFRNHMWRHGMGKAV